MKKVDYIIVGGGMAGVLCAQQLRNKNQKVLMITDPATPSASYIAAGTWNPIAFKRYILSWRAKEFLAEMKVQYGELEKLLGVEIHQAFEVKKLVTPGDELALWNKQASTEMGDFMVKNPSKATFPKDLYLGEIKQTGRIILHILIDKYHQYLKDTNSIIFEKFYHGNLIQNDNGWAYNDIQCQGVIFCEGAHNEHNPYFSWLPLKPAKGDIITISAPELNQSFILKKNIFVLPLGEHKYQVGATYNWKDLSWEPSDSGLQYLTEKLKTIINVPFEVINRKAGVRPTAHDRRVLMGEHPDKKGMFVLNGLGTKGVLLAPLAAKEFSEFLVDHATLNKEMNIERCLKYYDRKIV
ncbi:MAG: glycine oxidase [Saprospiraceae bacterium]